MLGLEALIAAVVAVLLREIIQMFVRRKQRGSDLASRVDKLEVKVEERASQSSSPVNITFGADTLPSRHVETLSHHAATQISDAVKTGVERASYRRLR